MQTLTPLTSADLLANVQSIVWRFEVWDGAAWIDVTRMDSARSDVLPGWDYRKEIEISGEYVDATLTDFPVCVQITNDTDIGAAALSSGYDIRFTTEDGSTLLKYERESFTVTAGSATGVFWVKVPTLTSAGLKVYVYFGNADAADGADPTAVWDSDFAGVWHMKDLTTSTVLDSTANVNTAAKAYANEPLEANAKIGKGQDFAPGSSKSLGKATTASLVEAEQGYLTFEVWAYVRSTPGSQYDIMGFHGYIPSWGCVMAWGPSDTIRFFFQDSSLGWHYHESAATTQDVWHHIAVTYDKDAELVGFFIDGVKSTVATGGNEPGTTGHVFGFGNYGWNPLDGVIDEGRLSSIVRSDAWLKYEYHNMADAGGGLTFGAAQYLPQNYLKSMSCQVAGAGKSTEPVAGSWSATLDNGGGLFHPYHPSSDYNTLIRLGRKARLSWGVTYSANAITDGGFESWTTSTDLASWYEYTEGTSHVTQELSDVYAGTYSCRYESDHTNAIITYQPITLAPSTQYRLSLYYKRPADTDFGLNLSDSTYTVGLQSDGTWGAPGYYWLPEATSWTEYEIVFTTPAGYSSYNVYLYHNESGTGGDSLVDSVRLERVDAADSTVLWQRMVGFMDTPRFDNDKKSVAIQGTDYMRTLADTKLYSPYTAWGTHEHFETVGTGGFGTEQYNEGDAADPDSDSNSVGGWLSGGSGGSIDVGEGYDTDFGLRFTRDTDGNIEQYAEEDIFTATAGKSYMISFWGKINAGTNYARLVVYEVVGGVATQRGARSFSGEVWDQTSLVISANGANTIRVRISTTGKYALSGDQVDVDDISIKEYTTADWTRYDLASTCNGVYYAELDGEPVWKGDEDGAGGWHYEDNEGIKSFFFSEDMAIAPDLDLAVYYYTTTDLVDILCDLMVAAKLYADRATAKTALHYTDPNIDLEACYFDAGATALDAVRMLCERANYRFYFDHDGVPHFVPAPTLNTPSDLELDSVGHLASLTLFQDIAEIRNHVIVTGAERSVLNVSTGEVESSNWKAEANDATSQTSYQKKTHSIDNYLFTDQTSVSAMCAALLAYYKDPKDYAEFTLPYCPLPIEIGDTVTILVPVSSAITVEKLAIIRAISLTDGKATYTAEIYSSFNTLLNLSSAVFEFTSQNIDFAGGIDTDLVMFNASISLVADNVNLAPPLTMSSASFSSQCDSVTLIRGITLSVNAAVMSSAASNITLFQAHTLAVQSASLSLESQQVPLAPNTNLELASCSFDLTASSPTLAQIHMLSLASCSFDLAASVPTLFQAHILQGVGACSFTLAADHLEGAFEQQATLTVQSASVTLQASSPAVYELRTLAVDAASISSAADNIALIEHKALAGLGDNAISSASSTPTLVQHATLVVQSDSIELQSSSPTLGVNAVLSVNSCSFSSQSDNVVLHQYGSEVQYTSANNGAWVTVPAWATTVTIECWGPGGNGGDVLYAYHAGGAGGGAYSLAAHAVTYGNDLRLWIPAAGAGAAGGPTFVEDEVSHVYCSAENGEDGTDADNGEGGQATGGVGDTKYSGGNGYYIVTGYPGGGGGSSAGTGANGNNATSSAGATAPTGGGNGGNGGARYSDGEDGSTPGGGGGGAGDDLAYERYGGAGGGGRIHIRFSS